MQLAVIDIGTNSVHMVVVRIDADLRFHVLDKAKEMVHLGRGTFESGRLDESLQRRAIEALTRFRRLAERRGVREFLAVATSAVREAENGGAFLQEVYRQTGIHPRVISGTEEARLVFKAVQATPLAGDEPFLVADLGGGSVEFAYGSTGHLLWSASLKLGVQRLSSVLGAGEPTPEARSAIGERIGCELASIEARLAAERPSRVIATSGSAVAVLKVLRGRGDVEADAPVIPVRALVELDEALVTLPRDERETLPGLDPERVDHLPAAVAFLRAVAELARVDEIFVSDSALREGVVLDYVDRHGSEIQWDLTEPNERRRAVLRLAERLHYDAPHAHHVAHLATRVFDDLHGLHGLDEAARELLEYGALLHDVGYVLAETAHHKHSEYLVLHGLRSGFTERETRIVAAVARYHRKAEPRKSHENFAALDAEAQELVRRAAAIVRVADAFDRSHGQVVVAVRARAKDDEVVMEAEAVEAAELEVWAARRKASMFESVFGRRLRVHVVPPAVAAPLSSEVHAP